jgi:hypothetical protein
VTQDRDEHIGSWNDGWLAWTAQTGVTWVHRPGAGTWRIGKEDTAIGSVTLDGPYADSVWFVRHYFGEANIARYDLRTHAIAEAPDGVNTDVPEYRLSASGDHLVFRRGEPNAGKMLLFKLSSGAHRAIAVDTIQRFIAQGR